MTTISNVNIVVQQGDMARDASQQARPQSMDTSQLTPAEQQEKDRTARSSVPGSEESGAIVPDKEQREKEKKKKRESLNKEKKVTEKVTKKDPDSPGRLLDTIA
ncbi:MAG: hypothetical protein C0403_00250 [Desulfobacterium sp.]|nr:hypothetical protein [Desulfobacterium sp.]